MSKRLSTLSASSTYREEKKRGDRHSGCDVFGIYTYSKWPGYVFAAARAMTPMPLAGELEMTPYPQAEKMGWHSVPSAPQHLTLPHFFGRDLTFLTALQVCQNRH